jgi:hypothetical protein
MVFESIWKIGGEDQTQKLVGCWRLGVELPRICVDELWWTGPARSRGEPNLLKNSAKNA